MSDTNTVYRASSLRLGKLAPRLDRRTLKLSTVFDRELPPIPDAYDFDTAHPGVDMPMYLNDQLGDCVIAARAHWTRRAELIEQGVVIPISDDDVKREYYQESGGADSGLVMLNSLLAWRNGWKVGGQTYSIDVFGSVTPTLSEHVRTAIYLLGGVMCGVQLPMSAQAQWDAHEVWDVPSWWSRLSGDGKAGSWGGHCMAVIAYDATKDLYGCITWGKKQWMTRAWFETYCDEAYGCVDSLDAWCDKPGINVDLLQSYLRAVVS